jgi:hypothetical protein
MSNTTITPGVGGLTLAGVAPTFTVSSTATATQSADGAAGIAYTWTGIQNGGRALIPAATRFPYAGALFMVTGGTLGVGGSIQLEGSNDGINWAKLSPAAITAVTAAFFTSLGAQEKPRYLSLHVTAGDSSTSFNASAYFSAS